MNKFLLFLFLLVSFSCKEQQFREEAFLKRLNVLSFQKNMIQMNIANANTTRSEGGGAFVPQKVKRCENGFCTTEVLSTSILKHEPDHPDANEQGYVAYPNVNVEEEKLKLEKINRAIDVLMLDMPIKSEIFFTEKAKDIFTRYPSIKSLLDFKELVGE